MGSNHARKRTRPGYHQSCGETARRVDSAGRWNVFFAGWRQRMSKAPGSTGMPPARCNTGPSSGSWRIRVASRRPAAVMTLSSRAQNWSCALSTFKTCRICACSSLATTEKSMRRKLVGSLFSASSCSSLASSEQPTNRQRPPRVTGSTADFRFDLHRHSRSRSQSLW